MEIFLKLILFRKHHTIKLLAFKMINVCAMYAALSFSFGKSARCIFFDQGSKFLALILMDLIVQNIVEFAVPLLKSYFAKKIKFMQNKGGDEAAKVRIDP